VENKPEVVKMSLTVWAKNAINLDYPLVYANQHHDFILSGFFSNEPNGRRGRR